MKLYTILVVDSDSLLFTLLKEEMQGRYNIIQAISDEGAISIMQKVTVDLVIIDTTAITEGFQLCSSIKTNSESSHVPVIVLTNQMNMNSKIVMLKYGEDVFIEKPFSVAYLTGQVFNLLQNRSKLWEYLIRTSRVDISITSYNETDQKLVEDLHRIINEHMPNTSLDMVFLAKQLQMSRASLYRRIKAITDSTPYEILNNARLQKALYLIHAGTYKVKEIAKIVGYPSSSQFSKNFRRKFNKTCSEYYKEIIGNLG